MLTPEQKDIVLGTLAHPAFAFDDSTGTPFYTEERLEILYQALEIMLEKINELHTDLPLPDRIETIIAEGLPEMPCQFSSYYSSGIDEHTTSFPDDRLPGRTAYGLLCTDDGANCIGFAETCCLLLNLTGHKATPIISKLLKGNQTACHYVTGVLDENGNLRIIDPERKRSCAEVEKQWSLTAYQVNIRYAVPDEDFCREKIGATGLGPNFLEFTSRDGKEAITPMDYVRANYPQILDANGRLDLRSAAITPEIQAILDEAIAKTVTGVYQRSIAMSRQPSQEMHDMLVETNELALDSEQTTLERGI